MRPSMRPQMLLLFLNVMYITFVIIVLTIGRYDCRLCASGLCECCYISLPAPNYVGVPTVVTRRWVFPNTQETKNEREYWDFETLAIQGRKRAHRIRCGEGCRYCLGAGVTTSPQPAGTLPASDVPHWPSQYRLTHTGRTCGLFSLDIEHLFHFFESLMRFLNTPLLIHSRR